MRLTAYTNYALRTLMHAALCAPELARAQDVADAHEISRAHLVKCIHQLGRWGYLENVRGRGGGFRLARPAEAITIGEIVRLTEASFAEAPEHGPREASDDLVCDAFDKAQADFLAVLDRHTIRDVVANADTLRFMLRLEPAA